MRIKRERISQISRADHEFGGGGGAGGAGTGGGGGRGTGCGGPGGRGAGWRGVMPKGHVVVVWTHHHQRRAVRLLRQDASARLEAFLLAGDTRAQSWIKTLLQDELPAESFGRQLLSPGATPPTSVVSITA